MIGWNTGIFCPVTDRLIYSETDSCAAFVEFASMLSRMDPEVAKKALEQFPEYAKSVLEIVGIYKEELDEMVASNNQSIQGVYDGYKFTCQFCRVLVTFI